MHSPQTCFFFFNDTATTEIYTLSLHDALPIFPRGVSERRRVRQHERGKGLRSRPARAGGADEDRRRRDSGQAAARSEEHTSELQSRLHLVCRLLLEKKKNADRTAVFSPLISDT